MSPRIEKKLPYLAGIFLCVTFYSYRAHLAKDVGYLRQAAQRHVMAGHQLEQSGRLDAALEQVQMALRFDPANPDAHFLRGFILAGKRDMEGAVREYQETLRLNPEYIPAHYYLGLVLSSLSRKDEAVWHCEKAYRFDASRFNDPRCLRAP